MTHEIERITSKKHNHKKIYALMKENGYLAVVKRKKVSKTSKSNEPGKGNIINRNFNTSCPYDKMATDVSEFKIFDRKIYISVIKDLNTNMIEANEILSNAALPGIVRMFNQIKDKAIAEGTIIHSDQGSVYRSAVYKQLLEENNFIQSMSRKGTPIDNSPMESFFSTLKSEFLYNPLIEKNSYEDVLIKLKDYISFYNNQRIQKKLGYLTPSEFKRKMLIKIP